MVNSGFLGLPGGEGFLLLGPKMKAYC